ncbi:MAG: LamG-like jellyroll fold domain-containing protein [Gammaproteobacteria bacterium]
MKLGRAILLTAVGVTTFPAAAEQFRGIEFPQGASSFADAVIRYDTTYSGGPGLDGTIPHVLVPAEALGPPDAAQGGFGAVSLGDGGLLEVAFTNNVLTNSGDAAADLYVFEWGTSVEGTHLAVRPTPETAALLPAGGDINGDGFFEIPGAAGGAASIDIDQAFPGFLGGTLRFDAVQIVDDSTQGPGGFGDTTGADIDAVGALSSSTAAVPTFDPELFAYYPLNFSAADLAGGPSGAPMGQLSFQPGEGIVDGAAVFDGIDDYLDLQRTLPALNEFTISMWIKPNTETGRLLSAWCGFDGTSGIGAGLNGGTVSFWVGEEAGCDTSAGEKTYAGFETSVPLYEWTHLAFTFKSGAFIKIYKGGKVTSENYVDIPDAYFSYDAYLGTTSRPDQVGIEGNFAGAIDDVQIFSEALSETEIRAITNRHQYSEENHRQDKPDFVTVAHITSFSFDANKQLQSSQVFSQSFPTILYTHGWQSTGQFDPFAPPDDELINAIRDRLKREFQIPALSENLGFNIVRLHWEGAYNSANGVPERNILSFFPITEEGKLGFDAPEALIGGARKSLANTYSAAKKFAEMLSAQFAGYEMPLHMIGHSHGSRVNALLADLMSSEGVRIDLFTILDAPTASPTDIGEFSVKDFQDYLPETSVALVDNYYGTGLTGFGQRIGKAHAHGGQGVAVSIDRHTNVKNQFYLALVEETAILSSWVDTTDPMAEEYFRIGSWISPVLSAEAGSEYADALALSPWGGFDNLVTLEELGPVCVGLELTLTQSTIAQTNISEAELGLTAFEELGGARERCVLLHEENSPSASSFAVQIPDDAVSLVADVLFTDTGDGDWYSILINGQTRWSIAGTDAEPDRALPASMPVKDFRGQTVDLQFALHSEGVANAEVYTTNITLVRATVDTDGDGIGDFFETNSCLSPVDRDTDDDGLLDSLEDIDGDGVQDIGETDGCEFDSDQDGLSDGVELGVEFPVSDPDGAGELMGTNIDVFVADADPSTTTDPRNPDSDGDGIIDGEEDPNFNGRVDNGESDPNVEDYVSNIGIRQVVALEKPYLVALGVALVLLGLSSHRMKRIFSCGN